MKESSQYKCILDQAKKKISALNLSTNEQKTKDYALIIANKMNFYDFQYENKISTLDFITQIIETDLINNTILHNLDLLSLNNIKVLDSHLLKKNAIYLSFHYSIFRAIPYAFIKENIPLVVVGGSPDIFTHHYFGTYIKFITVSPFMFIEIQQYMQEGRSLLIYIDADWERQPDNTKFVACNFLGSYINLRNNIFKFAIKTKCELIPIIAEDDIAGKINIQIYNSCKYDNKISEHDAIQQFGDYIIALFEPFVIKTPHKWIQWVGLHKMMSRELPNIMKIPPMIFFWFLIFNQSTKLRLNDSDYILFRDQDKFCILCVRTYAVYQMPKILYLYLCKRICVTIKELKKIAKSPELRFLLINRVLIKI